MSGWNRFDETEPAGAIASFEVDELLMSLVEKNLVVRDETTGRYRLLETIRDYGRSRLGTCGESESIRARHLAGFLALAEEADSHLNGPEQQLWLERLEAEHDNLRAALEWSLESADGTEPGLRLCGAVWRFWEVRGHFGEGRRRLSLAQNRSGWEGHRSLRADVLNGAGVLTWLQGDYASARALHEEGLAIRREMGFWLGIAYSLSNLGNVARDEGDYPTAQALHEESLVISRELGDWHGIANSLNSRGNVANAESDYPAARALHEESLAISRETGDRHGIASSLVSLGNVAHSEGD